MILRTFLTLTVFPVWKLGKSLRDLATINTLSMRLSFRKLPLNKAQKRTRGPAWSLTSLLAWGVREESALFECPRINERQDLQTVGVHQHKNT
ncbi:hypothetical protein CQ018_09880 [Arthrobacter sp. MYb227]|nr:hypothetical protein CQ018_09880 [Arthrobacter sp. MYb227]